MTVRAYKLGALGQDDLTGVKCLAASPSAQSNYMTFETPVGTDYQVAAGKTFYITKLCLYGISASVNSGLIIGYGDNGVADGVTAPTSWVAMTARFITIAGINATQQYEILIPIPAQKYPCAFVPASFDSAAITVFGIEV